MAFDNAKMASEPLTKSRLTGQGENQLEAFFLHVQCSRGHHTSAHKVQPLNFIDMLFFLLHLLRKETKSTLIPLKS